MYNPDAVGNTGQDGKFYPFINYERSHSASALDMDQERHNLPWNGSYSTSCAAIAWNKVDDTAGHNALGGTSWTVYGKKDDAVNGTNALATMQMAVGTMMLMRKVRSSWATSPRTAPIS